MEYNLKNSALVLISTYSDDDEDSEGDILNDLQMANQWSYSKATSNSNTSKLTSGNRLPLPSSITQLFKEKPDINCIPQDDPSLHDGRIRSFPHQRGNWSTYVYVPYEQEEGFTELLSRLETCAVQAGVKLKPIPDPHISLTRTVVLLHHWINGFVSSVKSKLSHIPRFHVQLGEPTVYCNEERTRTFLGLRALSGTKQLCDTVNELDQSLGEFRLPPFYKDPSFHMSVLWVVGDARQALETVLPLLQAEFDAQLSEHPQRLSLDVTQCLCKTGNKTFTFPLAC